MPTRRVFSVFGRSVVTQSARHALRRTSGPRTEVVHRHMATPRTKHSEYKRKLAEWARIFEQEYGTSPTDEDRAVSNTWNALNDKATYYKRLLKEQGLGSSPSLQTPSPSGRRSSGSRRESSSRESSSRESRSRESSSRDKNRSRLGSRSHESSPDLLQRSRSSDLRASISPEKSRRRSSRPAADDENVFVTAETAEAAACRRTVLRQIGFHES